MNMELAIGLALGVFLGGAGVGIWMGTIAHAQYEKYLTMKKLAFDMEQALLSEREGRTRPLYEMGTDGIDPVIRRRRPLAEQEALRNDPQPSDVDVIDLTGVEDE